jgi:hypothetical protein
MSFSATAEAFLGICRGVEFVDKRFTLGGNSSCRVNGAMLI